MNRPRTYIITLPVLVTVDEDMVTYDIETSEAAEAVDELDWLPGSEPRELDADIERIEADHKRRERERAPFAQTGCEVCHPAKTRTSPQTGA